ncbi:MAG: mechanosensitive ion channel family protein [Litoreibacter sp.]
MRPLDLFDPFIENTIWLASLAVVILALWLFGKRIPILQHFSLRYPAFVALLDMIAGPVMFLLLGSLIRSKLSPYETHVTTDRVDDLITLILMLFVAWCLARVVELFIVYSDKEKKSHRLPGLVRGLLFGSFVFISFVLFVYAQGYSITGFYISTGAVAALVAFAMQQTLGDLFSGIALSIEHPFKLGEIIRLKDGAEGEVIDINWRATRVLAWDNSTLVIPNSELARQGFINLHGNDHSYAPWYEVKIPADIDPRLVRALLLEAALKCDKILSDPLPLVRLADATTVPYKYMIWVHFANYPAMFAGREQLFQEIHYALKGVGAQVAPDIRELRARDAEAINVEPPTTLMTLRMLDIAKSLSDAELTQLAEMSVRQTFDAGTTIVPEGGTAQAVDVIIHGIVETSVTTDKGALRAVEKLTYGQYFGLTSMVMETPSFLRFTASTNVTLLRIDIDCWRQILASRPDLHDDFAVIMKQRMDAAQDARLAGTKTGSGYTIRDLLRGMERWSNSLETD